MVYTRYMEEEIIKDMNRSIVTKNISCIQGLFPPGSPEDVEKDIPTIELASNC